MRISLPNSTDEAWIRGGSSGLIVAVDTADVSRHGHRLECKGADTASLQLPLAPGDDFGYRVLHAGACERAEQAWL